MSPLEQEKNLGLDPLNEETLQQTIVEILTNWSKINFIIFQNISEQTDFIPPKITKEIHRYR